MNKTVTINISGIVFHIEEDAYEKLSRYITTIKGYFTNSEGRDEIMADIESRIAEILKEKIGTSRQVVLLQDVEHVMSIMGKPEDFAGEAENNNNATANDKEEPRVVYKRKRIFRDPDEKVLGGVCSGLANYIDTDPLWIRLGWLALVLFFGTGVFVYLVCWILIPEAKTTAEKLEMKGEAVNINNIKKTIEDEIEHLKKKVNDIDKNGGVTQIKDTARNGVEKFIDFFVSVFGTAFRILGKIVAFFVVMVCSIILVALIMSFLGFADVDGITLTDLSERVIADTNNIAMLYTAIILTFGVPLLMLLYAGVKGLLGIKGRNKIISLSSGALWLIGIILLSYSAALIGKEFKYQARENRKITISDSSIKTLYLKLQNNQSALWGGGNSGHYMHKNNWDVIDINGEKTLCSFPSVDIRPSSDSLFKIDIITYARGRERKDAFLRAKSIVYNIEQKDSMLLLDDYFLLGKEKLRAQSVFVIVYVPQGKSIFLDESVKYVLDNVANKQNVFDEDMVGNKWIMKDQQLNCDECTIYDSGKKWHKKINIKLAPPSVKVESVPN